MFGTTAYYLLSGLALIVFGLGLLGHLVFWLQGSVGTGEAVSVRAKGWYLLRRLPAFLFCSRVWGAFLSQGLLQQQLLRESKVRWLMHMSITWGCLELFFVGSLGSLLRDYQLISLSRDAPWFALINDVGGFLVLFGIAIAALRRYLVRTPQLRTEWEDSLILGWLALAVLSGYLVEAARLLAQGVSQNLAIYSFGGYGLSRLIGLLNLPWDSAHSFLWWAHAGVTFSLIAYIPFSKLFHLLSSPLSLMVKSVAEEPGLTLSREASDAH
jgi:nitrate reductase gamma subunit